MSEKIQVLEKPNNEINSQELKNIENALMQTDVDAIAIRMFKEIRQEKFEAGIKKLRKSAKNNSNYQQKIQDLNTYVDNINSGLSVMKQKLPKLDSAIKPFKLIISRFSNQLTAIDAVIEYEKTSDGLKVSLRIGESFIKSKIFEVGVASSIRASIIAFIALAIAGMSIVGAIIFGIAVLTIGIGISWWISQKAEQLINDTSALIIDYIKKIDLTFSISLTPQEREYFNAAHCHRTITNIQNNAMHKILINGYTAQMLIIDNSPNDETLKDMQILREQLWQIGQTR